ncbi:hypothetical protein LEMLEM_LOCUS5686 [Lemmus lemmus]
MASGMRQMHPRYCTGMNSRSQLNHCLPQRMLLSFTRTFC